jgi:hypothetical protein
VHPSVYFLFKTASASAGLVLQHVSLQILGPQLTAATNRIQLYAMALSSIVLPGIETVLLKRLSVERIQNRPRYQQNMNAAMKACMTLSAGVALAALFSTSVLGGETPLVLCLAIFGTFLFLGRIVPVLMRIEDRYLGSVVTEPGALMVFGCLVVLGAPQNIVRSPEDIWLVAIALSAVPMLVATWPRSQAGTQKVEHPGCAAWQPLQGYGLAYALIPVANFSILWGLATVGSFVLTDADITRNVVALRMIGLLLFVESIVVAFFLPRITAVGLTGIKGTLFAQYRFYLIFGTVGVSLFFLIAVGVLGAFSLTSREIYGLGLVALVQTGIAARYSPFALATVFAPAESVMKICCTLLVVSGLAALTVCYFKEGSIIIGSFAALQLLRAALADHALMLVRGVKG